MWVIERVKFVSSENENLIFIDLTADQLYWYSGRDGYGLELPASTIPLKMMIEWKQLPQTPWRRLVDWLRYILGR